MFRPYATRFRTAALLLAVLVAPNAGRAQSADAAVDASVRPTKSQAVGPELTARVRYGVTHRKGASNDSGRGLEYTGITPNDFALSGSYFLKGGYFGVGLSLQREGFALSDREAPAGTAPVTAGSLIRGTVGPSARVAFGPFLIEGLVGYSFAQLPLFGATNNPELAPAQRHSLMLASRLAYSLPAGFTVEAKGEVPIALATRPPSGSGMSSGFGVGGGLIYEMFDVDRTRFSAVLDYQFVRDSVVSTISATDAVSGAVTSTSETSTQQLSRFGVALQVSLVDFVKPPKPRVGGLLVRVFDEATGKPIPGAQLSLDLGGRDQPLSARADGQFAGSGLAPGQYSAKATAAGYLPAEAEASVSAGREETVSVALKKEPPKVGALTVTIVDKKDGTPLVGALVKVKGEEYLSNAAGMVKLVDLKPGPLEIEIAAKEFRPAKEVASIVAGRVSQVPVALNRAAKPLPATINGLVRSTRGGKPVAAELQIPEAQVRTRASAGGAFSVRLPGGTYRVIISADGYITQNKSVTVRDGDQAIFNVDLYPTR